MVSLSAAMGGDLPEGGARGGDKIRVRIPVCLLHSYSRGGSEDSLRPALSTAHTCETWCKRATEVNPSGKLQQIGEV